MTLGNVGTYSGVIGAIFTGAQQAIQVWAQYTNAHGGLNGHPVKVISADDGGDPSTNQSLVEQMVNQDHVIAFVGNLEPLTVESSLSFLQAHRIPVIGGDLLGDTWFQSPILFPQGSEIFTTADGTIRMAASRGKTAFGYLYCVEDPLCSQADTYLFNDGHARADGVQPLYAASYSMTQPSFTAQCLAAQSKGVNFLLLGGDGNSLERLARDCAAQNYRPLFGAVSIGVSQSMQSDPQLDGMVSTQATFPWMDDSNSAQSLYQEAIRTYAPGLVGSGASSAEWTSGQLAVAASRYLGSTPTSAQFLQGLWAIKGDTLGGLTVPITFSANAPAVPSKCYFEITLSGGHFVDPNHGKPVCE